MVDFEHFPRVPRGCGVKLSAEISNPTAAMASEIARQFISICECEIRLYLRTASAQAPWLVTALGGAGQTK
jgi:hypothetical protein